MPELDELLIKLLFEEKGVETAGYATLKEALRWEVGTKGKIKAGATAGGEFLAKQAVSKGVQTAFAVKASAGASAGMVTTAGVALFGTLGPVVAVWVGAAQVAHAAFTSFALWDLVPKAKGGEGLYACTCGHCDEIAYELAKRHDSNVAKFGASLFVVQAIYTVPDAVHDKFFNSALDTKKLATGTQLRTSAMPIGMIKTVRVRNPVPPGGPDNINYVPFTDRQEQRTIQAGCRKAQAIIATLFKEIGPDRGKYRKTLAAILSDDGNKAIANKIF